MELPADKRQIVESTLERAKQHGSDVQQQRWYMAYLIARDEGVDHPRAMEVADRFMKEVEA